MDARIFQILENKVREAAKTDSRIEEALKLVDAARIVGVEILKAAGFLFRVEGDAVISIKAELVQVDADVKVTTEAGKTIAVEYQNDTPKIVIDGVDLTRLIESFGITLKPRNFPQFNFRFAPGAIPINMSDTIEKK